MQGTYDAAGRMALSPLIKFCTSTWTYEGWQGQVYCLPYLL
jgi:hypothetical protein